MTSVTSGVAIMASSVAGMVTDWVSVITDNPLVLCFVLVPLVGIGIGALKRLIG